MTSNINACLSGTFPVMAEEDEDESPHMDMDETDEEVQDTGPALDDDLDSEVNDFTIKEDDRALWRWCIQSILTISSVLRA
jgi:hypothetical protein